jgi:hypothetical protein
LTYSDLWWIPFIALGFQIYTTYLLWQIHRRIGKEWAHDFMAFHIIGYTYVAFILGGLYLAANRPGVGVIEIFGLFFGFAYPLANNFIHLRIKRRFKKQLDPNRDGYQPQVS